MKARLLAGAALPLLLAWGPAAAQDGANEVWLGQVGNTNKIVIDQQGEGNRAGADNIGFLLNQDGDFNALSIEQFGWNNSVGATALGPDRPSGVNQVGALNEAAIEQTNTEPGGLGSNAVGALYQESSFFRPTTGNSASVTQSEQGAAELGAGHLLGSIRQVNDTDGFRNRASVVQTGGGVGLGNMVDALSQSGSANAMDILQENQSNAVLVAVQSGETNFLEVVQGDGQDNLIEFGQQFGFLNSMKARQSGSRNVIQQALQNNEILAGMGAGNRMEATISGEDNGGDGLGGVGEFISGLTLGLSGVAQATLVQLGDDNDLRLTIVQGSLTKFGFMQIGDGNGVLSAISAIPGATASRNEVAVFQQGDDNNLSHDAVGNDNVLAVRQMGERNFAAARQSGDFNSVYLDITGFDNNSSSTGGFSGAGLLLANEAGLTPGLIVQEGLGSAASLEVDGSRNLFAASQSGEAHRAQAALSGTGNHLVAVQTGTANTSLSRQSGTGNALSVRQY